MIELDEGFFSTEVSADEKAKPLKRGKGSQKKSKVLVMAQTKDGNPTKKSDKPTSVKYIKMFVIEDLKSETIDEKVRISINSDSDDSKSYTNFNKIVKEHIHQVIEPKQVGKVLPWVHIAIANAKRTTVGCLSRHSTGVPSELPERVLLEVQQKALWKCAVRQAYGGGCFIQKSI